MPVMANPEPAMDILDGSDVDEDNVGDVDADQENVLLESDDEEAHPTHQVSKGSGRSREDRSRNLEEQEDVLNIDVQQDELDYDEDENEEDGVSPRVAPVKVRNSVVNSGPKEISHFGESGVVSEENSEGLAASSQAPGDDDNVVGEVKEDNLDGQRHYNNNEDDDYEDDETETRTRSRFTSERNVDSNRASGSGHGGTSTIQTIQTLGEHKIRPNQPDGRPRHWNHNNGGWQSGPRSNGPRHPQGRNQRFPGPPRAPGDHPHMRPMMNPPVVQFNEGIFTDFNQPIRHPHQGGPRPPRQQLPPGGPPQHQQHGPRHPAGGDPHRHPIQPPNPNMRPTFPHQQAAQQQQRPYFPNPQDGQMGGHPPRMQPPGPANMGHPHPGGPQQQQPPRQPPPDFRGPGGQQRPRFPPQQQHPNQRSTRPPPNAMNQSPTMPRPQQQFPPRQQRPLHMSPDQMGMPHQRYPHQQGYPPQHHPAPHVGAGGGYMPPHHPPHHQQPPHHPPHNQHPPPRYMGPPGGPEAPHNSYYGHPNNYNHPPVAPGVDPNAGYPPDQSWHGHHPDPHAMHPAVPPPHHPQNHQWGLQHPPQHPHHQVPSQHPQQHPQAAYNGYAHPNNMYDHPRAPLQAIGHPNAAATAALPIAAVLQQASAQSDHPQITGKSIYIKPNSEIYDVLTKGGHFSHLKEEDRRHHSESTRESHSSSSPSKRAYDDDYDNDHHHHHHSHHYHDSRDRDRDRERSSSRRALSPERRRDRDDDYYYEDRKRHHYDDRSSSRRDDVARDSRRHRSDSPEKKMSRSDNYDRERDRGGRDKEREPVRDKEADKALKEAKSLGLGEDYLKKLEEQRLLRERILKTKEQRRKQIKSPGDSSSPGTSSSSSANQVLKPVSNSTSQKEADTSSGTGTGGKSGAGGGVTKKVLRIVKDKSGKIISKKVHVVVVGKPQDAQQSSATS